MNDLVSSITFVSVALIICLLLAWFFLKTLSGLTRSGKKNSAHLKLNATLHVGSRERVSVVEYRGKEYLIGVTATSIQLLDTHAAEKLPHQPM